MARNAILLTTSVIAFLFSGYIVFFYAPKVSASEQVRTVVMENAFTFLQDFADPATPDSLYLENLVGRISKYERVECGYIGYAGVKSTQFDPVNSFIKLATDKQLVRLINKGNPIVQHYAFIALTHKNPPLSKRIFSNHVYNRQTLQFFCGCEISERPINIDFFQTIRLTLTPGEYSFYKKKLDEQYKGNPFMSIQYLDGLK